MIPDHYLVFDVESVGLTGDAYAYGFVLIDKEGKELDCGLDSMNPDQAKGTKCDRLWIEDHCPELLHTSPSKSYLHRAFCSLWLRYQTGPWADKKVVLAADCPWPVEAKFLLECFQEAGKSFLPYPIIDVGSVLLAAGKDPIGTYPRNELELPEHNPLQDARQSARLLVEALKGPEQSLCKKVGTLKNDLVRRIQSYEGGDRPPSPPAYLIKLYEDLCSAHSVMNEKVMGDPTYG